MTTNTTHADQGYESDMTEDGLIEVAGNKATQKGYISPPDWSSSSPESNHNVNRSAMSTPHSNAKDGSKPMSRNHSSRGSQQDPSSNQPVDIAFRSQEKANTDSQAKTKDRTLYWSCIHCIRGHQSCDMKVPGCSRCVGKRKCIYTLRSEFPTQKSAVEAYKGDLASPTIAGQPMRNRSPKQFTPTSTFAAVNQPTGPSVFTSLHNNQNPSMASHSNQPTPPSLSVFRRNDSDPADTSTKQVISSGVPTIQTIDSNNANLLLPCPKGIVQLIKNHQEEFESTIVKSKWSQRITIVKEEHGRPVVYVDAETEKEIPVTRYEYGHKKQFIVGWPPQSKPAIFYYAETRSNKITVFQGKNYRSVFWKSWRPPGSEVPPNMILRMIEDDSQESSVQKVTVADLNNSVLHEVPGPTETSVNKRRQSAPVDNDQHASKKIRTQLGEGSTGERLMNIAKQQIPSGRASMPAQVETTKRDLLPENGYAWPSTIAAQIIIKDKRGEIQGTYALEECDTAQKLFTSACQALIMQVEPSSIRLFKVELNGVVAGAIRPDNEADFEKILTKMLERLSEDGHTAEASIVVSHAL